MASNPAVVCWDSAEHNSLMVLGFLGLLAYPVAILSGIAFVTLRYKSLVASGHGLKYLGRYRFVFYRFHLTRYFWAVFYLLRNFCITLVPVIFPESAIWQVVLIHIMLVTSLVLTAYLMPWRTKLANVTEMVTIGGLTLFMQVAAFLVDTDKVAGKQVLASILLAVVVIIFLVAAMVVCFMGYRHFFNTGDRYGAFLCHHKDGAACLARYIKSRMTSMTNYRIFLDSDQLEELDLIFDVVRTKTKNLVVLLTPQVLKRPWCAGEITTAYKNNIPIVLVACDDYVLPSEEGLAELASVWSKQEKYQLGIYGITMSSIKDAYRHLLTLEAIPLMRFSPLEKQEAAISEVIRRCGLLNLLGKTEDIMALPAASKNQRTTSGEPARIVIVGCTKDTEARISCEILATMFQERTMAVTKVAYSVTDAMNHLATAEYLVVVITTGLLQDSAFEDLVLLFERGRRTEPVEIVTVMIDKPFNFPLAEFYSDLEKQGEFGSQLASGYRKIFNILALPFTPRGSQSVITNEVNDICERFRKFRAGGETVGHAVDDKDMLFDTRDKLKADELDTVHIAREPRREVSI